MAHSKEAVEIQRLIDAAQRLLLSCMGIAEHNDRLRKRGKTETPSVADLEGDALYEEHYKSCDRMISALLDQSRESKKTISMALFKCYEAVNSWR